MVLLFAFKGMLKVRLSSSSHCATRRTPCHFLDVWIWTLSKLKHHLLLECLVSTLSSSHDVHLHLHHDINFINLISYPPSLLRLRAARPAQPQTSRHTVEDVNVTIHTSKVHLARSTGKDRDVGQGVNSLVGLQIESASPIFGSRFGVSLTVTGRVPLITKPVTASL